MPFQTDACYLSFYQRPLISQKSFITCKLKQWKICNYSTNILFITTLQSWLLNDPPIFFYSLNVATADSTVHLLPSSFHPVFQDKSNSHKSKVKLNCCYPLRHVTARSRGWVKKEIELLLKSETSHESS